MDTHTQSDTYTASTTVARAISQSSHHTATQVSPFSNTITSAFVTTFCFSLCSFYLLTIHLVGHSFWRLFFHLNCHHQQQSESVWQCTTTQANTLPSLAMTSPNTVSSVEMGHLRVQCTFCKYSSKQKTKTPHITVSLWKNYQIIKLLTSLHLSTRQDKLASCLWLRAEENKRRRRGHLLHLHISTHRSISPYLPFLLAPAAAAKKQHYIIVRIFSI